MALAKASKTIFDNCLGVLQYSLLPPGKSLNNMRQICEKVLANAKIDILSWFLQKAFPNDEFTSWTKPKNINGIRNWILRCKNTSERFFV